MATQIISSSRLSFCCYIYKHKHLKGTLLQLPLKLPMATQNPEMLQTQFHQPHLGRTSLPHEAVAAGTNSSISVKATVTVKLTDGGCSSCLLGLCNPLDNISDLLGKSLLLELVSAELDPQTGLETRPISRYAHRVGQEDGDVIYESEFVIPGDFGEIGAVLVQNEYRREMFLKYIVLNGLPNGPIAFNCGSWVQSKFDDPEKRIFFSNKSYLPSQTPRGLKDMREKELASLRGNGEGERKTSDRIYDYNVYNDLGKPDSKPELGRPVLGGNENYPYPRRCRTGRPPCRTDPLSETRSGSFYVPRDEEFSEVKEASFVTKTVDSVLHALKPYLETSLLDSDLGFPLFSDINQLYYQGITIPKLKNPGLLQLILPRLVKTVSDAKDRLLKFETPTMFLKDKFSWFRDEDFSRQTLAGVNPYSIKLVRMAIEKRIGP